MAIALDPSRGGGGGSLRPPPTRWQIASLSPGVAPKATARNRTWATNKKLLQAMCIRTRGQLLGGWCGSINKTCITEMDGCLFGYTYTYLPSLLDPPTSSHSSKWQDDVAYKPMMQMCVLSISVVYVARVCCKRVGCQA